MGRSEIRLTINRPVRNVFDIYTHADLWKWSDFRNARWTQGEPWEVESRMQVEPANSFGVVVDQVLTHFEPYMRVDFISHFGGVTMHSQVKFRALSETVTEIHGDLEFIGSFSRIAGFALGPAIEYGALKFYDDLKQECERGISEETRSAQSHRSGLH